MSWHGPFALPAASCPHLQRARQRVHALARHQAAPPRNLPLLLHAAAPIIGLMHVLPLQAQAARAGTQAHTTSIDISPGSKAGHFGAVAQAVGHPRSTDYDRQRPAAHPP